MHLVLAVVLAWTARCHRVSRRVHLQQHALLHFHSRLLIRLLDSHQAVARQVHQQVRKTLQNLVLLKKVRIIGMNMCNLTTLNCI